MLSGIFGKKLGMTQIFDADGNVIPVTVLQAGPCAVLEVKETPQKKIKLGFDEVKESRVNKPMQGQFKKAGVSARRFVGEFDSKDNANYKVGQEIKADIFKAGDFVNVTGVSIGKGFQGGMKRWNWVGGPASHGSMHHRRVGSIGASTFPGRVLKGQHMPGHMGADTVTVQNLRVMQVNLDHNLILVKGAVPGKKKNCLRIVLSVKKAFKALNEKKAVAEVKKNPMKQAKAAAGGGGKGGKK